VVWIYDLSRGLFFCRATVLLSDGLGLLLQVKAQPTGAPAANLLAAWRGQPRLTFFFVAAVFFFSR
jgi:hypothetical protein